MRVLITDYHPSRRGKQIPRQGRRRSRGHEGSKRGSIETTRETLRREVDFNDLHIDGLRILRPAGGGAI